MRVGREQVIALSSVEWQNDVWFIMFLCAACYVFGLWSLYADHSLEDGGNGASGDSDDGDDDGDGNDDDDVDDLAAAASSGVAAVTSHLVATAALGGGSLLGLATLAMIAATNEAGDDGVLVSLVFGFVPVPLSSRGAGTTPPIFRLLRFIVARSGQTLRPSLVDQAGPFAIVAPHRTCHGVLAGSVVILCARTRTRSFVCSFVCLFIRSPRRCLRQGVGAVRLMFLRAKPNDYGLLGGRELWLDYLESNPIAYTVHGLVITSGLLSTITSTVMTGLCVVFASLGGD